MVPSGDQRNPALAKSFHRGKRPEVTEAGRGSTYLIHHAHHQSPVGSSNHPKERIMKAPVIPVGTICRSLQGNLYRVLSQRDGGRNVLCLTLSGKVQHCTLPTHVLIPLQQKGAQA